MEDQYTVEHPSTLGKISVLKNNSREGPYPSNMILAGAILRSVRSVEVEGTVYAGL